MSTQAKEPVGGLIALLIIFGLLGLAVAILFIAHPDNFLTDRFAWLKTDHPGFLLILPICCWILAAVVRYDSQPLPSEYVPPPPPLNLSQNDAWRRPTGFRYLERLKEAFFELEKNVLALNKEAVEAHQKLSQSSGKLEYNILRRTIKSSLKGIEKLRPALEKLRDRIGLIASGDVRAEVLDIEEQIEKHLRSRSEYENEIREAELEIPQAKESRRRFLKNDRESRMEMIHAVDSDVIELRSSLKELREFDFNKLYGELGVSPEAMRTTEAHLQSIKNKADLVGAIKPPSGPVIEPPPDREKERAEKRAAIQAELERLEIEKRNVIATTSDDEMRRRIENIYDDKRAQVVEELRKVL